MAGREDRAGLGAADEQFQDLKRRLAKPQHPVTCTDSGGGEPGRDLTGPGIDLRISQPDGAIDDCGQLRPAAAVLPRKVAEGKRVHEVHGLLQWSQ